MDKKEQMTEQYKKADALEGLIRALRDAVGGIATDESSEAVDRLNDALKGIHGAMNALDGAAYSNRAAEGKPTNIKKPHIVEVDWVVTKAYWIDAYSEADAVDVMVELLDNDSVGVLIDTADIRHECRDIDCKDIRCVGVDK